MKNSIRLMLSRIWAAEMRLRGVVVGTRVVVNGRPAIRMAPGSSVSIEEDVVLNSYGLSNPLYCNQPVSIQTTGQEARIIIGAGSGLSACSICALREVSIGRGVVIGAGVMIFDNDFHCWNGVSQGWDPSGIASARPVVIEDDVFIGTRAIILKGVRIGKGAVVGAGAVVTRDVAPGAVVAGNPAILIRQTQNKRAEDLS